MTSISSALIAYLWALVTVFPLRGRAFSPPRTWEHYMTGMPPLTKKWISDTCTSPLYARGGAGGLFGSGSSNKASTRGGGGFGQKPESPKKKTQDTPADQSAGTIILEIPAKSVKVGPLRFLLQLFLSGDIQNKPSPKSWLVNQGERDGEIEVYYSDGTGMISIQLKSDRIIMSRVGTSPSLVFRLQESVLLHAVLDELHKVAFEQPAAGEGGATPEPIDPTKRLLQLESESAIEVARQALPARPEASPAS